jgi:nitrate/TMAO reductase-like tetraheme cytochrome c subunit
LLGLLVLPLAIVASCATPLPIATASDAARANVALAELEQGRSLLLGKCGSCHAPPPPASQKPSAWPRQVENMAERAKITAQQHHLIVQYLVAMATP